MEKTSTLTPAQYWEWRQLITENWLAEERLKTSLLEHKVLQRDAEILHVRTQLFLKNVVEAKRDKAAATKLEYEKFKAHLESSLGFSLNNKLIDDVTFEIKDMPEETKPLTKE